MFKIIFMLFIVLYSALILFSMMKASKNGGKLFTGVNNIFMIIGCIVTFGSAIAIGFEVMEYIFVLIVGLLFIHIAAILNGYKLYSKPHWQHHIVRFLVSIVIVLCYFLIVYNG